MVVRVALPVWTASLIAARAASVRVAADVSLLRASLLSNRCAAAVRAISVAIANACCLARCPGTALA